MLNMSAVSGKCGHNFHKHCITQWIRQESARGQCPMCRQSESHPASPHPALTTALQYPALVGPADLLPKGSR